jgi:hypothetical protein
MAAAKEQEFPKYFEHSEQQIIDTSCWDSIMQKLDQNFEHEMVGNLSPARRSPLRSTRPETEKVSSFDTAENLT